MKTKIILFSILICFFNCKSDDNNNPRFQPAAITFTQIAEGVLSGLGEENISESNLIINNDADWQNLITQMDEIRNQSDFFSETDIDFSNFTVIAIFLEIKPTGWSVKITDIVESETNISVTIKESIFDTQKISRPYYIAKIAKTDKEFVFLSE